MKSSFLGEEIDLSELSEICTQLFEDLFPLPRSLTGEANRTSLKRLSEVVPLNIHEIPSGTSVFDWRVPDEWNVEEAWLKTAEGEVLADFTKSNISLVSYSEAVEGRFFFKDIAEKIHSLPELPDAIPYRTSYYKKNWGFCLPHSLRETLKDNTALEVKIKSSLDPTGSLSLADSLSVGKSKEEVLISSYCCHPSMANDNLSGVILATLLYSLLLKRDTHYSYRLLLAPETIGPLAYLSQFPECLNHIVAGVVATCTAGPGDLSLKCSYFENHEIDRLARLALEKSEQPWREYPFFPAGSDERQFSSPGFRIPVLSFCKDKYYEFPEYHTSLDNLEFVSSEALLNTLAIHLRWIELLEANHVYRRIQACGEYQLGKRGLYPELGGARFQTGAISSHEQLENLERLLFEIDGKRSLLSISEAAKIPFSTLSQLSDILLENELIQICEK